MARSRSLFHASSTLFTLSLFVTSCGNADSRSSWTSGDRPCVTADACPALQFSCNDVEDLRAAGCVDGYCVDDRDAFAADYCADKGGVRFGGTTNAALPCGGDRECIECRAEQLAACISDPCNAEATTLANCMASELPSFPDGVVPIEWSYGSYGEEQGYRCLDQGNAYLLCVDRNCGSVFRCDSIEGRRGVPYLDPATL